MIKLIYDLCTATAERRPTTAKDIEEDIHVETFNTEEELLDHVAKLLKYDEDDLADVDGETPLDKVEKLIEWCNDDPGDGTPNFLYLSKDGSEIPCCEPYVEIEWMDLGNATKEEIVKELQAELNDEEERINREKDEEAERKIIDKELEETPVEKVVAEINSKTVKDIFDYYINLFSQGRMVITQQNYLRNKIANALQKLDNAEYTGKEIDHLLGYGGGPQKAIKFSYKSKDKTFTVICWEIERNWAKSFIDHWVDDPSLEDGAELDLTLPREYEMSHTKDGVTKYLYAMSGYNHLIDTTENHKEKKEESLNEDLYDDDEEYVEDDEEEYYDEDEDDDYDRTGYESDAESLLMDIAEALGMPYDDDDPGSYDEWNYLSLLHDYNNGRGDEWIETFEEQGLDKDLLDQYKKLVGHEEDDEDDD